jgi:hypothetical protein
MSYIDITNAPPPCPAKQENDNIYNTKVGGSIPMMELLAKFPENTHASSEMVTSVPMDAIPSHGNGLPANTSKPPPFAAAKIITI